MSWVTHRPTHVKSAVPGGHFYRLGIGARHEFLEVFMKADVSQILNV